MQVVSDIHFENRSRPFSIQPLAPYLACCGDIGNMNSPASYSAFLNECSPRWKHIFLVMGNHEYYGSRMAKAEANMQAMAAKYTNVTYLEKGCFDIPDTDYRIAGTTLWTKVPSIFVDDISWAICDYRYIKVNADNRVRKLLVYDTNRYHDESVTWIQAEMQRATADKKRLILLTHHAPITGCQAPKYKGVLNSAFQTDLTAWIGSPLVAWFYGHTHYSLSRICNGVTVQTNAVGYEDESNTKYDPNMVFNLK